MVDRSGQLEVEVIEARGLTPKPGSKSLPGEAEQVGDLRKDPGWDGVLASPEHTSALRAVLLTVTQTLPGRRVGKVIQLVPPLPRPTPYQNHLEGGD